MPVIIFPYTQINKRVEICSILIFGVLYEDSPVCAIDLNLYSLSPRLNGEDLLDKHEFRLLRMALIYYVYSHRNTALKGFFARKQFLRMSRLTKMIVIEAVKQAEKANTFSLMGSVHPTHL
jgi:hypothetical protein